MDYDAVARRQIRVMWIGWVWFLAAFMPLFLFPWRWETDNLVAGALLVIAAAAAILGNRVAGTGSRVSRHLFLSVPLLLVLASLAFSAWLAGRVG